MGLAIAQRFVQLMGGEIAIQSELNLGSTFGFSVRFLRATDCGPADREIAVNSRRHALVVGIDIAASLKLSRLLTELSFNAVCVASRAEAVRELTHLSANGLQRYDAVFIDCTQQGVICADEAKHIRRDCQGVPMPRFILVASPDLGDLNLQLAELKFDGAVLQPVTRSGLHDATQCPMPLSADIKSGIPQSSTEQFSCGPRILLVDDGDINRQVATEILEMEGYRVVEACDGKQALALLSGAASDSGFAAVLMDLQMPGMDGYTTTRLIRSDSRFIRLPIIAMTGDAVTGVKEKCLAVGMNDFLTKPIRMDEFYATLKKWTVTGTGAGKS